MNQPNNTRFRLAELVICLIAVVLGILYLYPKLIPLSVLLPLYAVFFLALAALRLWETKRTGQKGFAAYLPAIASLILAFAVLAAAILFFMGDQA